MIQSGHPTRVLLVGATGMLGTRTAHHLLTQGAERYPDLRPETFDAYARRIWPTAMTSKRDS